MLAMEVRNKLSHQQYDLTSWSARSWLSFQTQKLSVKLHLARRVCMARVATPADYLGLSADYRADYSSDYLSDYLASC